MKPEHSMTTSSVHLSSPNTLHKANGYSHLAEVRGGRLVYIAGQVAQDVSGALVGNTDFRAQVGQVFANLKTAVEAAGGSFADIIKLNYFCCERVAPADLPCVREIRDQFVNTAAPPVSTFVFVSRLVRPEWLIEIEAVALVDGAGR
jgi:enamine deaminase RidA (YjgF/YER057c/UK114 family)